jgi:hypothetical protein
MADRSWSEIVARRDGPGRGRDERSPVIYRFGGREFRRGDPVYEADLGWTADTTLVTADSTLYRADGA